MSLLSSFIAEHLLSAIEAEFAAKEPALQDAFLSEVSAFGSQVAAWVEGKLATTTSAQ